jgi:hypothetical protein
MTMATLDEKVRKLQELRKKADEISQKKQRLAGELDGHEKRQYELEKQCKTNYGCDVDELPSLITQLGEESGRSLEEAERLLSVPATPALPAAPEVKLIPVSTAPAQNELAQGGVARSTVATPVKVAQPMRRAPPKPTVDDEDVL